ncbi:phage tail protein, partial [Vibrio parahaemolyticus]|nr:phage tail protein [Vibrio parahaemolyticus]
QNTHDPLDGKTIKGKWFGAEGRASIRRLREIKRMRAPVLLTDDYGYNMGLWKIMSLNDDEKDVIDDGTPMIVSFTITFEEFAN